MMQINLMCTECVKQSIKSGEEFVEEFMVPISGIQDSPIYDVLCKKGHKTKALLRNEKFEILFDLGLNGLADGYFREAVLSFTGSLERFYEFFLRITTSDKYSEETYTRVWKVIKNQSERQLGAYMFAYLHHIGEPPQMLTEEDFRFRNNVVHKGYIPNLNETLQYGEAIRRIVNDSIRKMKVKYGSKLETLFYEGFKEYEKTPGCEGGCNITTVLDVCNGPDFREQDIRNLPLAEIIPILLERRSPQRMRLAKTLPPEFSNEKKRI